MCYYLKDEDGISKISNSLVPVLKERLFAANYFYAQYAETGFSTCVIQDESSPISFITSVPGLYNWTGSIIQYNNLDYNKEDFFISNPIRSDKKIEATSYFGYSIAYGRFNSSNPKQIFYVSGAPRNSKFLGTVTILDTLTHRNEPFKNKFLFQGIQTGEYFGSSVTVADVNGDHLDDVIIGAPMFYTNYGPDVGRIFVYLAVNDPSRLQFRKPIIINGEVPKSRFGFSLSNAGDLNRDGFEDVIVGAPYYNDNGAIYVYLGAKNGLPNKPSQKIYASEFSTVQLRGFGFSISRGLDINNNSYNDIAVGAYLSGHVVILKTRPIISVTFNLDKNVKSITFETNKFNFVYDIQYFTKGIVSSLKIKVILHIRTAEVTFENNLPKYEQVITLKENVTLPNNLPVLIKGEVKDSINMFIDYEILPENHLLNEERHEILSLRIPVVTGCKINEFCEPNLQLTNNFFTEHTNITIGSGNNIDFSIFIKNIGEVSINNFLLIQTSPPNILRSSVLNCITLNVIKKCEIKNRILTDEMERFEFNLNISKLTIKHTELIINVTVVTDNEVDPTDNTIILKIPIEKDIKLNIVSKSQSEIIDFKAKEDLLFFHEYAIENSGKTLIDDMTFIINIPHKYSDTEFLTDYNITGCTKLAHKFRGIIKEEKEVTSNNQILNCHKNKDIQCKHLLCTKEGSKITSVEINIKMKFNSEYLDDMAKGNTIIFTTSIQTDYEFLTEYHELSTKLVTIPTKVMNIVLVGFGIGIILVIVLIFILYKCNCFKKKNVPKEIPLIEKDKDENSFSGENPLYGNESALKQIDNEDAVSSYENTPLNHTKL